jgi:hypothetical protein
MVQLAKLCLTIRRSLFSWPAIGLPAWRFIEAEILARPRTLYRALLIERLS